MKADLSLPDKCPICNGTIVGTTWHFHCSNEHQINFGTYFHFWQDKYLDRFICPYFGLRIPECLLLIAIFINDKWFIFNEKDFRAIYNLGVFIAIKNSNQRIRSLFI